MDMSEFSGARFLRLDDVRTPRQDVIVDCQKGNFDKPELIFKSGNILTLNMTSVRTLIEAYGSKSQDWIGKTIEMYVGQVQFKDGMTDAALVKPISPPTSDGKLPNDDISF